MNLTDEDKQWITEQLERLKTALLESLAEDKNWDAEIHRDFSPGGDGIPLLGEWKRDAKKKEP